MVVVKNLACDECGSLEGVSQWRITRRGKTVTKDLCVVHGQPLEDLVAGAREDSGGRAAFKLTTREEIDNQKRLRGPRSPREGGP